MTHLRIEQRIIGRVAILDLDGDLTIGEGSALLRDRVRALLTDGHKSIIVNMNDVAYVDSSGLGELVSAFTTAKREDAGLRLFSLTERVRSLLQMTRLLTVFETFKTEEDAVRSFDAVPSASTAR